MPNRTRSGCPPSSRYSPGATIRDVAASAGVSVATVSRVFNSVEVVRDRTARRVREAARCLQYVPHVGARSLSMRRTATLGVLLPDLHGEFFSEVIRGIDSCARQGGYHVLVSGSHSDWDEMAAVLSATRGRVDGLIVMSPDLETSGLDSHLPTDLPVVLLNCPSAKRPSITVDNRRGSAMVVRHLASLGHRRIAFVGGPECNADAVERFRGYRATMSQIAARYPKLEFIGDFTEIGGYNGAAAALEVDPRPTAIYAANDAMAIGALCALRNAGIRVPEEIAVVGFDDIPIARYVAPPLTTVGVDLAEFGRRAVELLLDVINQGNNTIRREILPPRLVVRESCGAGITSPQAVSREVERRSIHRR